MSELSIKNMLNEAHSKKEVISIFTDKDQTDKCSTGYILAISKEQIILNHLSSRGCYDGYVLRNTDYIYRVDIDTDYESRLATLYNKQGQNHPKIIETKKLNTNLLYKLLNASKCKNLFVSLGIDADNHQEDIVGRISSVNNQCVSVARASSSGLQSGTSFVFLRDIQFVNCDTESEQLLSLMST
jgi:hypothetical protein